MEEVNRYIDSFEEKKREWLTTFVTFMRKNFPDIPEVISYQMPTFKFNGTYIAFSAEAKNHFSFHTLDFEMIEELKELLPHVKFGKGCAKVNFDDIAAIPVLLDMCVKIVGRSKMRGIDQYILGISDIVDLQTEESAAQISLTALSDVQHLLKKRKRDSHKGTYGRVGFCSGSVGMSGAAVLNLNAALRSGSGLVKGYIPKSIYSIVETGSIESITHPFDENQISFDDIQKELIDFSDVIGTGSGCTNYEDYSIILHHLLENFKKPIVIDAQGLNVLDLNRLMDHRQKIILTPHYGEMARLLGKEVSYLRENIIEKVTEFVAEYDVYLVLKGARTLIACPDGRVFINTTGNPGMATAGSGDVLTGIIVSMIGQKMEITDALRLAVFLHGMAGDLGADQVGEYSLIASDIIKYLPEAFISIIEEKPHSLI